jgi:hypothetical protein
MDRSPRGSGESGMMPSEPAGDHVAQPMLHIHNMKAYCGRYKGHWWLMTPVAKSKYPVAGKTASFDIRDV